MRWIFEVLKTLGKSAALLFSGHLMVHASQRVPITDWYKKARVRKRAPSEVACILMHDQTTQGTLFILSAFTISYVACNLMHDQTTQGTLFTLSAFMISCVACSLMHDQTTQGTLFTLSNIHDFVRSVHLDARPDHAKNVIQPFRIFTISCVACILMHGQTTQGTLFTLFGHS